MEGAELLQADHVLEYPYSRSTGHVVGTFLGGLRDRRVLGIRAEDGRVLVPPQEYDPITSGALSEWVEVGTSGVVTTWTWQPRPRMSQPFDRPFGWALVRLDGADTALLHAVDAAGPAAMRTGMRVRIRWADEPRGRITDIACFEPEP